MRPFANAVLLTVVVALLASATLPGVAADNCSSLPDCTSCSNSTATACVWCDSSSQCLDLAAVINGTTCSGGVCSQSQCYCSTPWEEFWPYSARISGQLVLMLFYGVLLATGAKYIADGSEMLMEVLDPGLIGGLLLPILGAFPDAMMIIVSGAFGSTIEAQKQIAVGMGTLAGSTVMLLTIVWASAVMVGRCDLENGVSVDKRMTRPYSLTGTGVTVDNDTRWNSRIALCTTLAYLIMQSYSYFYVSDPTNPTAVNVEQWLALAGFIVCLLALIAYCAYQVINPKIQAMRAEKARKEAAVRNAFRAFMTQARSASILSPSTPILAIERDSESADAPPLDIRDLGLKWRAAALKAEGGGGIQDPPARAEPENDSDSEDGDEEHSGGSTFSILAWSITFMVGGTLAVSVFSDPMVSVITSFGDNIGIGAFYISFVITPFCSNASELISSLMFAAKKRKKNSSLTFSALYGAATMNNTMCLGIFFLLIYVKGLVWEFSAEVSCILLAEWVILALGSSFVTFPSYTIPLVYLLYPVCLGLVVLLESSLVGWT